MDEENNAGGAEEVPDIAGVDGFVGSDDEEGEPDARAQDRCPGPCTCRVRARVFACVRAHCVMEASAGSKREGIFS